MENASRKTSGAASVIALSPGSKARGAKREQRNHGCRRSKIYARRIRAAIPGCAAVGLAKRRRVILEDLRGQVSSTNKAAVARSDRFGQRPASDQADEESRIVFALLPDDQPHSAVAGRV